MRERYVIDTENYPEKYLELGFNKMEEESRRINAKKGLRTNFGDRYVCGQRIFIYVFIVLFIWGQSL